MLHPVFYEGRDQSNYSNVQNKLSEARINNYYLNKGYIWIFCGKFSQSIFKVKPLYLQ